MQTKFGGDYQKGEMPKWMAELHTKMTSKDSPSNVPLFIVKIICNRPVVREYFICALVYSYLYFKVFEPYAGFWMRPLLNLATLTDLGNGFHYFLRDICILLLKWKGIPRWSYTLYFT
jgi:hypothetical protein